MRTSNTSQWASSGIIRNGRVGSNNQGDGNTRKNDRRVRVLFEKKSTMPGGLRVRYRVDKEGKSTARGTRPHDEGTLGWQKKRRGRADED